MLLTLAMLASAACQCGESMNASSGPKRNTDVTPASTVDASGGSSNRRDARVSRDASPRIESDAGDYAAPGSEPGVPGPSTRVSQPMSGVFALRADSPDWLYVLQKVGLFRVPTPAETADPAKLAGELLDIGRLSGPWTQGDGIYWVDLDRWVLLRTTRDKAPLPYPRSGEDAEVLPIGLPRTQGEAVYSVVGSVHGGALYLAKDGCAAISRIELGSGGATTLAPWPKSAAPSGTPALAVDDHGVYCLGGAHLESTVWVADLALRAAKPAWSYAATRSQARASISNLAAAGDAVYWIVTPGAYPTPSELHAYDGRTGIHAQVAELVTQLPGFLQTDRADKLYWQAVDVEAREVLRVFDLASHVTHDTRADFGLVYVDAAGQRRVTHLLAFTLAGEHIYWLRGNPGSRPTGAGDDIMRLPRSLVDP